MPRPTSTSSQVYAYAHALNMALGLPTAGWIEKHEKIDHGFAKYKVVRSAQIGHICVERTDLGWQIQQIVNDGGAVIDIGPTPRMTTKQVTLALRAMVNITRLTTEKIGKPFNWEAGNA